MTRTPLIQIFVGPRDDPNIKVRWTATAADTCREKYEKYPWNPLPHSYNKSKTTNGFDLRLMTEAFPEFSRIGSIHYTLFLPGLNRCYDTNFVSTSIGPGGPSEEVPLLLEAFALVINQLHEYGAIPCND